MTIVEPVTDVTVLVPAVKVVVLGEPDKVVVTGGTGNSEEHQDRAGL